MLETRLLCVKNWIGKYAPKNFKFLLNKQKVPLARNHLKDAYNYKRAFSELKEAVANETYKKSDKEMANYLYVLIDRHGLEAGEFFKQVYLLLINKEEGPKLGHFLNLIEKEKILKLL